MGYRIGDNSWLNIIRNHDVPALGSFKTVKQGEALLAPPKDMFWKRMPTSPGFVTGQIFQLKGLKRYTDNRPLPSSNPPKPLKEGDVIGVRQFGLRPHLPQGLHYEALEQPEAPKGSEAADLYAVRSMLMVGAFVTIAPVLPPLKVAKPIPMFPDIPEEFPGRQPWDFPPAIPTGVPVKLPAYAAVGRGGRIFGADLRPDGGLMVAGA